MEKKVGVGSPRGRIPDTVRVLIIDDEPVLRATFQYLLEEQGYRVWVAENGREGVDLFSRIAPDIVITDMLMPELDGFETIERIRHISPSVPIIAMSAAVSETRMERAIPGGVVCCVRKPIDEHVLMQLLHAMLEPEPTDPQ